MEERRKRLLVVEDETPIARVLALHLSSVGYEVEAVGTGNAAVTYAAGHSIDLVLLDLRLPDMDGYDVCKQLRKSHTSWDLPIVMVTALDQPANQLRGFAHGADAYITKPFHLSEICETVALLLGETSAT